jgi:hypothetical protein
MNNDDAIGKLSRALAGVQQLSTASLSLALYPRNSLLAARLCAHFCDVGTKLSTNSRKATLA